MLFRSGAAGLVDPRSDVFSFGVLLFEWLSGKPPFPGETPERVMKAQRTRAAPKLELRETAGEADGALSAFVESFLETEMEKRPSSDAVVRRLGEFRRLHPRPVLDLPQSAASVYRVASIGYALLPRRFDAAPALRRLRAVSFPEPPPQLAGIDGSPNEEPSREGVLPGIGSRPGVGGFVLALGILAFVAACALAAFLVFRR